MPGGNVQSEEQDPVTGLLPSQKQSIVTSWNLVCENMSYNGVEFFIRLFTEYPKGKQYFSKLRDCTLEELRSHPALISHAEKAMTAISHLVDSLDDTEELVHAIQTLAQDHKDMGINAAEFKMTLSVLQATMKSALGEEHYDTYTENAWQTCCDVIQTVVEGEMNKT